MGRLKKFFFGSSSSKRNKHQSDGEPPASPSTSTAASPSPSQTPRRQSRLRRSLSMKRLRRSFRSKDTSYVPPASKPHQWQQDEKLVRAGTCNFSVKYLGSIEVAESRGMQICEEAAKQLRLNTRKKVRAILWVSSDGLRVVEEESKGLIVDQTIEKVSFCAPDRNNDKGFSYICRDGTTRRWLCHCFHSLKEPGERLSHAVGCAFAACLERKQQRDKLCGVKVEFDVNKTSFTRQGSFRVQTMTESMDAASKEDEEEKENEGISPMKPLPNPHAIPRRHASSDMLLRQGSMRGLAKLKEATPFKRQLSLRLNELPSTLQRQQQILQPHPEVSPPTSPQQTAQPVASKPHNLQPATNGHSTTLTNGTNQGPESISEACAELSAGLFELSKQDGGGGAMSPPRIPERPVPVRNVQPAAGHRVQATQPGILQPEPGPIKQKNPWESSPAAPQPSKQPAPPPRPLPAPGLTQMTHIPVASTNPWVNQQPRPTAVQTQSDAEQWLAQTSQVTNNPFAPQPAPVLNGQHMTSAQVHGGMVPVQNGVGMHPQPVSASVNFNNANNMAVHQPVVAGGGISGNWTADLSRTLPQSGYSPNVSNMPPQQSSPNPNWSSPPNNQASPPVNNPFTNAVKTFEINL